MTEYCPFFVFLMFLILKKIIILVPVPLWRISLHSSDPVLLHLELERTVVAKRAESDLRTSEEKHRRGRRRRDLLPGTGHVLRLQVLVELSSKDGITDLSLAGWQAERKGGKNGGERTAVFVKQNLKLSG